MLSISGLLAFKVFNAKDMAHMCPYLAQICPSDRQMAPLVVATCIAARSGLMYYASRAVKQMLPKVITDGC
jgi:hypothetical protein